MPITSDGRSYVAGKYGIELDGIRAGWVQSVEGGNASAEVVTEKVGSDHIAKKHLAGVKYDDITVNCGTGMSKGFYEWVKSSFDHKYARKNGAIVTADYNYKENARLNFFNALITEIGFPALDAASKDPAKLTVKFTPEYTRQLTGGGGNVGTQYALDQKKQKQWLPSNFRLKIDGLDATKVSKIDALTVKQKVIDNPAGEERDFQKEPASLEIPNLVVTLAESHAAEWYKWHEAFVIKGQNGDDQEKGGTLEYLTPDLKNTLFTVTFQHLGIFKLTPEKVEAGSEQIRRVKAEMYCEDLTFDFGGSTWA